MFWASTYAAALASQHKPCHP